MHGEEEGTENQCHKDMAKDKISAPISSNEWHTLGYDDATTTSKAVTLLNGQKFSDFKTLVLCAFDGTMEIGSITLAQAYFGTMSMSCYAFALSNYNAVVTATKVSDTVFSVVCREITGWTQVRVIMYGLK